MPRTVVTPIVANRNAASTLAYTAVAAADDASIRIENGARAVVLINAAAECIVSFKAGTGVQSWLSAAGDVTFTVPAGQARVFGPFDSARFENSGGELFMDVSSAATVAVLQL